MGEPNAGTARALRLCHTLEPTDRCLAPNVVYLGQAGPACARTRLDAHTRRTAGRTHAGASDSGVAGRKPSQLPRYPGLSGTSDWADGQSGYDCCGDCRGPATGLEVDGQPCPTHLAHTGLG